MTDQSTADRVLNALSPFNLKQEAPNRYRCNRPWSAASDSMGLTLRINDGEHGTYYDHVQGQGGSLYGLAKRLEVPHNGRFKTATTKRAYVGLVDYARAHGVPEAVFLDAGWRECTYSGKPALRFPTENGDRYRMLSGGGASFRSQVGYRPCWYGLEQAVDMCWENEHPLVLCNGEPSVLIAQHFGLPACAVTSGEKARIPPHLLRELQDEWSGEIFIAPDCDSTGRRMGQGVAVQLEGEGFQVRVLDLNGGAGFDLGDFCALHQGDSLAEFSSLQVLSYKGEPQAGDSKNWMESECTDIKNALRLGRLYKSEMCWVQEWGWLVWTGTKWERDRSDRAIYHSRQTARSIYREAADAAGIGADERAKQLAKWARTSSSRPRLEAALALARCDLSAHPAQFDTEPYLLNLQNGTLNLRTGELQPHDPGEKITRLAGTAYNPDVECPEWLKFVDQVFDQDQALIEFIQRALGYSLTGSVDEQVLFFLYGTGANGKSTFLRAIMGLLGDYAKQSAPQLIMLGDRHPSEQADLFGARFVATIEVEEGRKMAEVLVKQLTGGDLVKARYMHKDWFEFEPTHKIWLAANHKPIIRGSDHAIWRRIRLVPFTVTIPESEQDRQLLDKLTGELPGMLNWALGGCLAWQELGLQTPEVVRRSTSDYRGEMDLLAAFIQDCCVTGEKYEARASYLYQAFTRWCEENGERPWTQRAFGLRLGERGFPKRRMKYGNVWQHIGLVDTPEPD